MATGLTSYKSTTTANRALFHLQKRFRVKQKWASHKKKKTAPELALEHFDTYYQPLYGDLWPSIRVALLSQQKYCCLANTFTAGERLVGDMVSAGASDMIRDASNKVYPYSMETPVEHRELEGGVTGGEFNPQILNADMSDFMPPQLVISERDKQKEEEHTSSIYKPSTSPINIVKGKTVSIPGHLSAYAYPRDNPAMFDPPGKSEAGKLDYYPMDGASILPVIALDLQPGSSVLDLCAAPGGKTLAMLMTNLPSTLTAVDHSYSRLQRLKTILRSYLSRDHIDSTVDVIHSDSTNIANTMPHEQFDRVLVDAPCFTDRQVLFNEDNNIFRPGRAADRINIQTLQRSLLFNAIQMCRPGGSIVYSTCTLAPPQNDGVINAVLQRVWQETDYDVTIQDLSDVRYRFDDHFVFYGNCRFGQLVLPNVRANFGPMYFCKLLRLK